VVGPGSTTGFADADADADSDEFGPMDGPEEAGPTNTYARVWVELEDLAGLDIRPSELRAIIAP
jgi:hypothetical protein